MPGATVDQVTHDPALARLASRVVTVRDRLIVDNTGGPRGLGEPQGMGIWPGTRSRSCQE